MYFPLYWIVFRTRIMYLFFFVFQINQTQEIFNPITITQKILYNPIKQNHFEQGIQAYKLQLRRWIHQRIIYMRQESLIVKNKTQCKRQETNHYWPNFDTITQIRKGISPNVANGHNYGQWKLKMTYFLNEGGEEVNN